MAWWGFNVVGKQFHVTEPKLLGLLLALTMVGVFSYSKEKIECN